jgi:Uncharacterized conserved protein (DUF2075)
VRALNRSQYQASIDAFLRASDDEILGALTANSNFAVELPQRSAWLREIEVLRASLRGFADRGWVFLEFELPRLGRRMDVAVVLDHLVFVIEFKVGEHEFQRGAIDQVWDYALDLKNFHQPSHQIYIVPVLIATAATPRDVAYREPAVDGVFAPVLATPERLDKVIALHLESTQGPDIHGLTWARGRYSPTPTIVEAARELYAGHAVDEISRSDAGAVNLSVTSKYIDRVISEAQQHRCKAICLVTGVPGAGKTLVGLDIATTHMDPASELHSVFLSGNGPLVAILREALARDLVLREKAAGRALRKGDARRRVETFIQNVHHFRDECLKNPETPPHERVAIFDEAQRAWTLEQTAAFMRQKKGRPDFDKSEPEFLISCMDRHSDWAVIVCLVGGGQEINTGEAGITEWIETLRGRYPDWHVHLSPRLTDAEYGSGMTLKRLDGHAHVVQAEALHLGVSMRSFRAERVSDWVKLLLDREEDAARRVLADLLPRYPIHVSRSLGDAKRWLKSKARGSERYGLIVSSQAQRLKPHAIDVRAPLDPVHWFLDDKEDVRSSFYLEDAATEFHVQGLELDWACVVWDADFRVGDEDWEHWSFVGDRWQRIRKAERQAYLKNAYRVLLTRARQGMVIVVPEGDAEDRTRDVEFFDSTYEYLTLLGLPMLAFDVTHPAAADASSAPAAASPSTAARCRR